jgi:uncharacterized protein YozE (UPF0346 family)
MDNFICTHCNYSLTIKKTTDSKITIVDVKKPKDLIEYYNKKENKEQIQLDIKFELAELEAYLMNNNKKNIKDIDKTAILQFYRYNFRKNISKYNLICSTCGTEYMLKPETVIYSLNFKKQQSLFDDDIDELIDLKFDDQTLPRTKDYICPYNTCDSNKKNFNSAKKEAVFYRASGSFHMKYGCLVCRGKPWNI